MGTLRGSNLSLSNLDKIRNTIGNNLKIPLHTNNRVLDIRDFRPDLSAALINLFISPNKLRIRLLRILANRRILGYYSTYTKL